MSGLNRAVFCLACGEIIPEAGLAGHISTNPTHALIPYHHNIVMGGGDPVGAIISGSLSGSKRLHVDGSRTDTNTPESGTAAQPFRTIQAAIDAGVLLFSREPFTLTIEQALYVEEVVMPDFVTIDCPVGAILRRPPGPSPSDALTVTALDGDAEPIFGATVIRGLRVVSDGDDGSGGFVESWCLRVIGDNSDPMNTREPMVISHVCSFDAFNQGNYLYNQGGALFLTGDGGMGGDGTGGVGVKLKPLPDMGAMCLSGTQMIAFGSNGLEIYENSFFVGNGTRFQAHDGHPEPNPICINMDATAGFSLVSIYQPSQMFGDPAHFIKAVGPGGGGGPPGGMITLHGGYNDIFDGVRLDAVDISGSILFRFVDGGIRSAGGRGIVLNDALMWIRNANVVSGDGLALEAVGDDCNVDSIDTTYEGHVAGGAYGPCVSVDVANPSVQFNGGELKGAGTVLDVLRGGVYLTGGVDIDPATPGDVAYHIGPGASISRGHCNVRRGTRVVDAGPPMASETMLPSGFGQIDFGIFNAVVRMGSGLTLPGGGQGFEPGSIFVWWSAGGLFPGYQLYQNINTEAAPTWKPISNGLLEGSGNPNGSVEGHAGLFYRDTDVDTYYICNQDSSQIWQPLGDCGGIANYDRVQMEACGQQDLGGASEGSPLLMPFSTTPILGGSYTVISPGVIQIEVTADYRLSFNLPFENVTGIPLDSLSAGACWQWSDDSGSSWNDILQTKTFDLAGGIEEDRGALNLPPIEQYLEAGKWLRVVAFYTGLPGTCYVNGPVPDNWAWARIERGWVDYAYTPGNPSDWDLPLPTTIAGAIDVLAAKAARPAFVSGVGDPRVVPVIGVYAGQIYKDTAAGIYYVCEADGTSNWGVL